MNIEKEREAFESTQNTKILFERIEYLAGINAYMPKPEFANQLLIMQTAERFNFGWSMWQASALRAEEKLECCVVVPVELSDDVADGLVSKLFEGFKDIFNSEHRDLPATEREQLRLRWSRNKARTLQEDYKLLVEAARGGNE